MTFRGWVSGYRLYVVLPPLVMALIAFSHWSVSHWPGLSFKKRFASSGVLKCRKAPW